MFKKTVAFVTFFVFSLSFASGEKLGNISILEGKPLPFNKGVSWEYDGGYVQVFIHEGLFALVFLDYDRKVRKMDNVDLAIIRAQSVPGNGHFLPYHLQPSLGGTYFFNPRHVFEPYRYNIELSLRKQVGKIPSHRIRRLESRYIKESFEIRLLDQR